MPDEPRGFAAILEGLKHLAGRDDDGGTDDRTDATDAPQTSSNETPTADPYSNLAELDIGEVIARHPKGRDYVEGTVGSRIVAERSRIEEEVDKKRAAESEKARLGRLRDEDPLGYLEALDEAEAADATARRGQVARDKAQQEVVEQFDDMLRGLMDHLDESARAELASKPYGDTLDARREFLGDVVQRLTKRDGATQEDRGTAARAQEALDRARLSQPRPGVGGAPPTANLDVDTMSPTDKIAHALQAQAARRGK